MVRVDASGIIDDLKQKVKESISRVHADRDQLTVWETKGEMIINNSTSKKRLAEILRSIDVDDEDAIEEINESQELVELELPNGQTLLVRLPGDTLKELAGSVIVSKVDENYKYKDLFLRAETKGKFSSGDIELNEIMFVDENNPRDPQFVKDFEKILTRKRKLDPNTGAAAKKFVRERTFEEYFDCSTADTSESGPDRSEVGHLIYISLIPAGLWDTTKSVPRFFKKNDANWLFFFFITRHFESLHANGEEAKFTVKRGADPWPFKLIVKVDKTSVYHTYRPKNDFLLLKCGLPRVAVEVNSISPDRPPVDLYHLVLQGVSIVRFANAHLDAYKKKKTFVFLAIFITATGQADRYLLYQKEDSRKIYCKIRSFKFANEDGRARFALEMYNLSASLDDESESDAEREVDELTKSIDELSREHQLPTFTGKTTKGPTDGDGRNKGFFAHHGKGDDGGATEQLETCGYEVVPDVPETDGGTWELISKLPPHIRTVYRRRDPKKTELIAKHVREGSNELDILNYLRTIRPQSVYVISLIDAIPSTNREWLILPKLHSIDQRLMNRGGSSGRVRLGWGLIKGLAYLHEHKVAHQDIKPENLVCDGDFRLQIIDFDVAIKVQDENTMIDEYRGTENWTAPEMGKEDGPTPMYSPIKADRWSCGRVLLYHIVVGKGDKRFSKFADQLMANDPQQRPSLLEWHKWLAAPPSDVANVEVDGESMKPPVAKRPKLTLIERAIQLQPELYGQASRPMVA